MKGNNILILFTVLTLSLRAQYAATSFKSDEFEIFEASKNITVVLTGNESIDTQLKDAVAKNWTLTPVAYITSSELDSKISDKSTCFLTYLEIIKDHEKYQTAYHMFAIIPGGFKNLNRYNYGNMLAYCPIDGALTEQKVADIAFRFPLIIASLQNTLKTVKKLKMSGNQISLGKDFDELNCKKLGKIKTKTLLVNKDIGLSEAEMKEAYKYKFELCSKEKIAEAIRTKDPNYVVFQSALTQNKFVFIFDCETYMCIYSNMSIVAFRIKQKDISEIIKQLSN